MFNRHTGWWLMMIPDDQWQNHQTVYLGDSSIRSAPSYKLPSMFINGFPRELHSHSLFHDISIYSAVFLFVEPACADMAFSFHLPRVHPGFRWGAQKNAATTSHWESGRVFSESELVSLPALDWTQSETSRHRVISKIAWWCRELNC